MTRGAMAKKIEKTLGMSELDGVRHTDRPTAWLRKMVSKAGNQSETVECPKVAGKISLEDCSKIKINEPEIGDPDCVFCKNF